MTLCVLSNLNKPYIISYIFPLLSTSLSQKHSLNRTEELGSLIDQRKSDTRHKGCSDYRSEPNMFSIVHASVQLMVSKPIILQYKNWRHTRKDSSCSLFKSKSTRRKSARRKKKVKQESSGTVSNSSLFTIIQIFSDIWK